MIYGYFLLNFFLERSFCIVSLDFFIFFTFLFNYFLKVMVSRVVGTYFLMILVMVIHLLARPRRCWKRRASGHHFHVETDGMAGTAGIIEGLITRGIVKDILGKPAVCLPTHLGGQMI